MGFTSALEAEFYHHFDPKMSSLGLLEAKIKKKDYGQLLFTFFCGRCVGLVFSGGALLIGGLTTLLSTPSFL